MVSTQENNTPVSVITPVYNGAGYLADCIESVLAQTRGDFQYIIADNCSTDDSLAIARRYAAGDDRIRIIEAAEHVGPIQNWNRSLRHVSDDARYVKFVHADDWIYPECLERMITLADSDEHIAIVSAYRLEEDCVTLDRLPRSCRTRPMQRQLVLEGRDVGRAVFLEYASVFGSPTSLLFRADATAQEPFFDESLLHADKDACIRLLSGGSRFGFIREVLTYTRRHNESVTSLTNTLDTRRQDDLQVLVRHGHRFLDPEELAATLRETERLYYAFLARSLFLRRGAPFWASHRENFARAGLRFRRSAIATALLRQLRDPRRLVRRIRDRAAREKGETVASASHFLSASRKAPESDS